MPTLFLSFTATLRLMTEGEITQAALDSGLFYFGCTRDHAFGNPEEARWFKGGEASLTTLREALLRAEQEGRVLWRGPRNTWQELESLLSANGINVKFDPLDGYSYLYAERQLNGMVAVVR
jgi:hypothetical protein